MSSSCAASCSRAWRTSSSADDDAVAAGAARATVAAASKASARGTATGMRTASRTRLADALRVFDRFGTAGAQVDREDALAHPDRVRRHLDELVGVDPLHG